MERIPQSATIRVPLKVYLSSDHVSPATGVTLAVVVSKDGGAFANPSAGATNATEIGNGWYYVDLSTTDAGTLGPLLVRGTAASCDDSEKVYDVVNANTGGWAALPSVASGSAGGLITSGTGTSQLSVTSGVAEANVVQAAGVSVFSSDGTLASATATTVTFPATDAGGNAIPDDARYAFTVLQVVGGTGQGQVVLLTSKVGTRTFDILAGTCPVTLDATSEYTVAGTWQSQVAQVVSGVAAADVWNGLAASYDTASTMGFKLNAAASAGDPWSTALPGSYGAGTAGNIVGNNLNATVTSRQPSGNVTVGGYAAGQDPATLVLDVAASSHDVANSIGAKINASGSAGDPWATAVPGSYGAGTAGHVLGTNLDAQVSTRLATSGYMTPPSAATIAAAVMTDVSDTVGADVVAIKAKTDQLTFTSTNLNVVVGAYATGLDPASSVLDALASSYDTANTIGAKINAAGTASDPWATDLPGSYAAGTAGHIIGTNLDAQVSTRLAASGIAVDGSGRVTVAPAGLDAVAVEGMNIRQAVAMIAAESMGVLSGANTSTLTFKAAGVPGTTRIVATVDATGRTGVTLTPPA